MTRESARASLATALSGLVLGTVFAAVAWFLLPTQAAPVSPASEAKVHEPPRPSAEDAGSELTSSLNVVPGARPTQRRVVRRSPATELTSVYDWPAEPPAPTQVAERSFAEALVLACGPHADLEVREWYAPWILRYARMHGTDPFLVGALMIWATGCSSGVAREGKGLTGLRAELYGRDIHDRAYRYVSFVGGAWQSRSVALDAFPFTESFITNPESSIYFAAAFLRMWNDQQRGLRVAFPQPSEYRHYVSHYVWGDEVRSHREEDLILVQRRRMLEYYDAARPRQTVQWHGFEVGCPLDGCPRVVTSTLGDARAGGARIHAGNDFESLYGEPVRAVADGVVVFAGVDLPGRGAVSRLPIWAQRNVDSSEAGPGGLYVCIDHGRSSAGESLVSCAMHLDAATVVEGRTLRRGEQIGRVGRSGIKQSKPHLHLELHTNAGVRRAVEVLAGLALGGSRR